MAENKNIISQDVENREITVNEDGSIKVIETLKTIYTQQYREFLSDFRGMQKYEENIKELFTNEFKKKREDDLKKIQKEKDKLAPYVDEAEKKWIEFNEKKQKEDLKRLIKSFKKRISNSKILTRNSKKQVRSLINWKDYLLHNGVN